MCCCSDVLRANHGPVGDISPIGQLLNTLQGAKPEISWWGSRVCRCANGDSIRLVTLAKALIEASHMDDEEDITREDRIHGLDVLKTLRKFYKATDTMIAQANIITWLFFKVLEFFGVNGMRIFGERLMIDSWDVSLRLKAITKEQFPHHFPGFEWKDENMWDWNKPGNLYIFWTGAPAGTPLVFDKETIILIN